MINLRNLLRFALSLFFLLLLHTSLIAQQEYANQIRSYLKSHMSDIELKQGTNLDFVITDNVFSKHNGVRHIHICQTVNDIKVENAVANITIDKNQKIIHISGRFIQTNGKIPSVSNSIQPKEAIRKACEQLTIEYSGKVKLLEAKSKSFLFSKGTISQEEIPVKLIYWASPENDLQLAWSLSIHTLATNHWWHAIIDANTGLLLNKFDWVVHCSPTARPAGFPKSLPHPTALPPIAPKVALPPANQGNYRVYALPTESPNHGGRSLVIDPANSFASPFGWHDTDGIAGAEFTITRGNNTFAYEDSQDNNAPGNSPDGGSNLNFDFPINLIADPSTYQDASITNLFYLVNRIHDITYLFGFDEVSGNFQFNNYNKGGAANDEVIAEAQDGGGTNNANFGTPPDGSNPKMQMFLWSSGAAIPLTVNAPAAIAGVYQTVAAGFGAPVPTTPITANVVLVNDSTAPDINDACEPLINSNDLQGKIALINRRDCQFIFKVQAAQNAGAIAVIMINNVAGPPFAMGGNSNTITIPSIMISMAEGQLLTTQLNNGTTVNATIQGTGSSMLDGDLDNGIIIHEYGHGISTRLTGGANNSSCLNNAEQMGEGWSDYFATMLTIDLSVANPVNRPMGSFASGNPITGPGIRNEPYDTSFAVNGFTYGDVSNTALLSEPHGVGFVWCTMLWDLTWAFMNQYGIDGDLVNGTGGDNKVMQLVMDGLKLQPCNPGFVDGRDAILLADQLNNNGANQCLIWKVFAKRGLGFSADQGSSASRTDQVEAFDLPTSCENAIFPPVAFFKADTTFTCSGQIFFTDQSTNIPQQWRWDFGDGIIDSIRSPEHQYINEGIYTVTLIVSNNIGTDTLVRVSYIEFNPLDAPSVMNGTGCLGDSILLFASGSGTLNWLDSNMNLVASGLSFTTPPLTTTTSFQVINEQAFSAQRVGPLDETFSTGGYHNSGFTGTINFTTEKALSINSAYLNAGNAGTRDVFLWNRFDGSGNMLQQVTINPDSGSQRVLLGFEIPGPGNYSIGLSSGNLYRNNADANYPYTIPGLISLVSSSATTGSLDFYYYFYDLEVAPKSCISNPVTVTASLLDSISFSYVPSGFTIDFSFDANGISDWIWNFGDGDTSTLQNPSHTYDTIGLYSVTLSSSVCSTTEIIDLNLTGIATQSTGEVLIATLQPNPSRDYTVLTLNKSTVTDLHFSLMTIDGQVANEYLLEAGSTSIELSLTDLAPAVYYLLAKEQVGIALKLVVVK